MTPTPRICIVGAGFLASRRIYPYIAAAGGKLIGVCDLDEERASRNASLYGGEVYTDMEEMLVAQKPDGVMICVGPHLHAKLAGKALRLGFPVYTEKPPAENATDALEVARRAREKNLLCMTGFKKRHTDAAKRAKAWIGRFAPSDLLSISIDYCSAAYANDSLRTSFLLDFTVHILDLALHLFGEVEKVFAFSKDGSAYAVSLRFSNGAVGSLNLNDGRSFTIPTEEIEITARGGNFMTIHNSSSWRITENQKCSEWREPPTFTSAGDSGRDTGHLSEIEDFFQALREGRKDSLSSIAESYKTMVLYEAIRQSAESGQVIHPIYENP